MARLKRVDERTGASRKEQRQEQQGGHRLATQG